MIHARQLALHVHPHAICPSHRRGEEALHVEMRGGVHVPSIVEASGALHERLTDRGTKVLMDRRYYLIFHSSRLRHALVSLHRIPGGCPQEHLTYSHQSRGMNSRHNTHIQAQTEQNILE